MQTLTTGTLAGTGSFRCTDCDYSVTLQIGDALPECPGCGGSGFVRASMFATAQFEGAMPHETADERQAWLARAKALIEAPGRYLAYEVEDADEDAVGDITLLPIAGEWTRIGRSLAADLRLDDPTVSRRHALIVRQPDGVRVLDDRSLNGVFVNGERVEWSPLGDGDEILVGRYRIHFIEATAEDITTRRSRGRFIRSKA